MANGEMFHNYAGGAQNIATVIALIVGGWWTYSVFQQTKQTAAAEERLANERFAYEKSKSDLERQRRIEESQRAIIPSMDAMQLSRRPRRVSVKLRFVNPGDQEQRLALTDIVFEIRRVRAIDRDGVSSLGPERRLALDLGGNEYVKAIFLPPGGEAPFEVVQEVPAAGVYLVRLTIEDPKRPKTFYDFVRYVDVR